MCRLIQVDTESGAKLLLDGRNILVLGFIFFFLRLSHILLLHFLYSDLFLFLSGMYENSLIS